VLPAFEHRLEDVALVQLGVAHQRRVRPAQGADERHDEALRRENEWREIGLGAQILRDLGISSIELITSRERHYVGLEGFGIRIARTQIMEKD
jgi:3,4-dihydroxy 2-butanone 4-phosphate synthase/GTP cyclohydrolase II